MSITYNNNGDVSNYDNLVLLIESNAISGYELTALVEILFYALNQADVKHVESVINVLTSRFNNVKEVVLGNKLPVYTSLTTLLSSLNRICDDDNDNNNRKICGLSNEKYRANLSIAFSHLIGHKYNFFDNESELLDESSKNIIGKLQSQNSTIAIVFDYMCIVADIFSFTFDHKNLKRFRVVYDESLLNREYTCIMNRIFISTDDYVNFFKLFRNKTEKRALVYFYPLEICNMLELPGFVKIKNNNYSQQTFSSIDIPYLDHHENCQIYQMISLDIRGVE